jgi:hypothetical protein
MLLFTTACTILKQHAAVLYCRLVDQPSYLLITGTASFPEAWPGYRVSAACRAGPRARIQQSYAQLLLSYSALGVWGCDLVHVGHAVTGRTITQSNCLDFVLLCT